MGTKYVKKKKLRFEDGYFFYNGEIVAIDSFIVGQFNHIETMLQQAYYMNAQPEAVPEPSLDGFKRESMFDKSRVKTYVSTPLLDREIVKAIAIMDEIDSVNTAENIEKFAEDHKDLLDWIDGKKVWITTDLSALPARVDTPRLGNPLEIDIKTILHTIVYMETGEWGKDPCVNPEDECTCCDESYFEEDIDGD